MPAVSTVELLKDDLKCITQQPRSFIANPNHKPLPLVLSPKRELLYTLRLCKMMICLQVIYSHLRLGPGKAHLFCFAVLSLGQARRNWQKEAVLHQSLAREGMSLRLSRSFHWPGPLRWAAEAFADSEACSLRQLVLPTSTQAIAEQHHPEAELPRPPPEFDRRPTVSGSVSYL